MHFWYLVSFAQLNVFKMYPYRELLVNYILVSSLFQKWSAQGYRALLQKGQVSRATWRQMTVNWKGSEKEETIG